MRRDDPAYLQLEATVIASTRARLTDVELEVLDADLGSSLPGVWTEDERIALHERFDRDVRAQLEELTEPGDDAPARLFDCPDPVDPILALSLAASEPTPEEITRATRAICDHCTTLSELERRPVTATEFRALVDRLVYDAPSAMHGRGGDPRAIMLEDVAAMLRRFRVGRN